MVYLFSYNTDPNPNEADKLWTTTGNKSDLILNTDPSQSGMLWHNPPLLDTFTLHSSYPRDLILAIISIVILV